MATDRQIAANRDNAKLSSGPRTEEGKAISSRNNTSHNLTAKGLIISPGLEDDFSQLETGLRNSLQPDGELQHVLFARLLECSWNLHRCRLAEQQLYQSSANIDPLLDDSNAPKYDRIQKYARQYESSVHKSLRALADLQTEVAYRLKVSPITEDHPATLKEFEATPHALSEACRYQKVMASIHSQEPKSQRSATDCYLESLLSRHQSASNWNGHPEPASATAGRSTELG